MKVLISFFLFFVSISYSNAFELKIKISNIKSASGNIKAVLFNTKSGFPGKYENAFETAIIDIYDLKAEHTFKNLPEDTYAIAVFHDVNWNDDLDTNRIGIPIEPFGFSNNPNLFGPPTFKKCRIYLNQDQSIEIKLKKIL